MFNVTINNEQYDEFMAQKDKIKDLEMRNEFLRGKFDDLYEENVDRIKKCDTLEKQVDDWKMQFESAYEHYQQALSEKVALIKERDRLKERNKFLEKEYAEISELNLKQGEAIIEDKGLIANQDKMIETLIMDIRFKEIVTENYRLRMSNNDLKANNKTLKKENEKLINRLHDYESQIAELAEKATNPDYAKFLEMAKKFQESNVGILTELEEATQPERNVTIIENLYLTNNYFSEEDKDNE